MWWRHHDTVKSRIDVTVRMPCNWLPGLAWVHWTSRDFAFALALGWHVECVCVWMWVWDCDVAVFDRCARLQAVVQEVWELYFSGLVAYVG